MQEGDFVESRTEMEELLREEVLGYFGLVDEGQPYVVPLNYTYLDGRILFHGAFTGRKMDCIRANPKACFTVARQTASVRKHGEGDPCHVDSDSVICYGVARIVDDLEERQTVLNEFNERYRRDANGISRESAEQCAAVEIHIEEMSGRREREKERTYWRFAFKQ